MIIRGAGRQRRRLRGLPVRRSPPPGAIGFELLRIAWVPRSAGQRDGRFEALESVGMIVVVGRQRASN